MVSYTANLGLRVPVFDQEPWDEDINGDLYVIDAAVGKFFGLANIVGVWRNSTLYTTGQSVVDYSDGSIWTCMQTHTSSATPVTFVEDRFTYPNYWVESVSTAQEYAQAAASSAGAAANSATAAANSATDAANSESIVAGALPLTGGTMTGAITLAGDPANVFEPATKQYVDARVGGVGFLPTTGGTMTGPIVLPGNPISPLEATAKQYVDTMMPKTGGTFTGSVGVSNALGVTGAITGSSTIQSNSGRIISYGGSNPSFTAWNSAGYAGGMWTESGGTLSFGWCNGDGTPVSTRMYIDRSNNMNVDGRVRAAAGVMSVSGSFYVADNTNYYLGRDAGTGTWYFVENGQWNFSVRTTGDVESRGALYTNAIYSRGQVGAGNASDFYIGLGGAGRILNFASNWYLEWNSSTGTIAWQTPSGPMWFSQAGNFVINQQFTCNSTGVRYANIGNFGFNFRWDGSNIFGRVDNAVEQLLTNAPSDERLKVDIAESKHDCLATVMKLPLHQFRWRDMSDPRYVFTAEPKQNAPLVPVGLVAQRVQKVLPDTVVAAAGEEVEGAKSVMSINTNTMLALLIGAMQQVCERLEAVETRLAASSGNAEQQ